MQNVFKELCLEYKSKLEEYLGVKELRYEEHCNEYKPFSHFSFKIYLKENEKFIPSHQSMINLNLSSNIFITNSNYSIGHNDNSIIKKMYSFLHEIIKSNPEKYDFILSNRANFKLPKSLAYKSLNLIGYGEKSLKVLEGLELINQGKSVSVLAWSTPYVYSEHTLFRSGFTIELNDNLGYFSLKMSKKQGDEFYHLDSKEDINNFINMIDEKIYQHKDIIEELLEEIRTFDSHAYYDYLKQIINIFNQKIFLNIKTFVDKSNKEKIKISFNGSTNQGSNQKLIVEKVKVKIKDYLIKNRLKATISGKLNSNISRFIHKLNGNVFSSYLKDEYLFEKFFLTDYSFSEFNNICEDLLLEDKQELDEKYSKYYELYLRSIGRRFKIVTSFKIKDFYFFKSASGFFVITEEEIKNLSIDSSNFKNPKYNEELNSILPLEF